MARAYPYIDTNILVRYITKDQPQQAHLASILLDQLETGAIVATTCEAVLVETVHVLSSKVLYNLPRDEISSYLTRVIKLKGLKLIYKRVYLRALAIYSSVNIDFTDSLLIAHMERERSTHLYSFDQDFDRMQVQTISRIEPA
jgi:predicted nucleic acid-binding protein